MNKKTISGKKPKHLSGFNNKKNHALKSNKTFAKKPGLGKLTVAKPSKVQIPD